MNRATYDINELIKLVPEAKGTVTTVGTGGLNLTIETIISTVLNNYEVMSDFAHAIQGNTVRETAYNVWHFIKSQTEYQKDKALYEEIRTPQRTISDKKGDCDDYSILAAAVFRVLNYDPFFYVVAFHKNKNFGHIYVGVENIVIDGVMNEFDTHPDDITKTMIVKLTGKKEVIERSPKHIKNVSMIIQQLEGLSDKQYTDFVGQEFNRYTNLDGLSQVEQENFNKIKLLKLLEGTGHRDIGRILIPAASKVDDNLDIYFEDEESAREADGFITEYEELQGLGNLDGLEGLFSKLKKWHKKQVRKAKKTIKKVVAKAKKVAQFVKKIGFAPARGAFLLLLSLNFLHFSEKLYLTYLPISTVKNLGLNMSSFKKMISFRKKFERFWVKAGGKKGTIYKVVSKRGKRKATKRYGLKGLGVEPVSTASTAAAITASPFVVFFKKIWGAVKGAFGKISKGLKDAAKKGVDKIKGGSLVEKGKEIFDNYKNREAGFEPEEYSEGKTQDTTTIKSGESSDGSNKMLLLVPAAAVLFMLIK